MSNIQKEIQKHIKKCIHPLKEEKELLEALKLKLTKKELKLLKAWSLNQPIDEIKTSLNCDDARYQALSLTLIKKLNQERIKQAICI